MDLPGGQYLVVKVGETAVAGMMAWPDPAQRMASAWGCYVTVDDVDAALARCQARGGTVQMPAMDIPKVGRMACIRDPQGASINIIGIPEKPRQSWRGGRGAAHEGCLRCRGGALRLDVSLDGFQWRTACADDEVRRRPQHAFPVFRRNVGAISAHKTT